MESTGSKNKAAKKSQSVLETKSKDEVDSLFEKHAALLRGEGLSEKDISRFLSGAKKFTRGIAFNKADEDSLKELKLERFSNDTKVFWNNFPAKIDEFKPSERFYSLVEDIPSVCGLKTEAAKRTMIDTFLVEVLTNKKSYLEEKREEKENYLNAVYPHKFWCEYPVKRRDVWGKVDYVIGNQDSSPEEPFVVVVEAKVSWPLEAYCQLLLEMYGVLKKNEAKDPAASLIYGVLSNEEDWQFYKMVKKMNEDGSVKYIWYESPKYTREFFTIKILGILDLMINEKVL